MKEVQGLGLGNGNSGDIMSKMVTLIEAVLYIFLYMTIGIAFLSVIYDVKWLSFLDKPLFKIIYGLYLGWLGFFSCRLSRGFIEHDIMNALFPVESIIYIVWGIAEHFEYVLRSTFFSTPSGALTLFVSILIPYYYGNIHNSIFRIWKEKRNG